MPSPRIASALARGDVGIVSAGLVVIVALAWASTIHNMSDAADGAPIAMPNHASALALALMWISMMIAMMAPAAAPMVLAYAQVSRRVVPLRLFAIATAALLCGYLGLWLLFSVAAAVLQWWLSSLGAEPMPRLTGTVAIVAGIYQFTPLKHACLAKCRVPLGFFLTEWRPGSGGAFVMGVKHAAYCVGCCWMLMALLFASGAMDLLLMAAVSLLVLAEKVLPRGDLVSRVLGGAMILAGLWTLLHQG
jgi:predicted metal-binding membrane protein